MAYSNLFMRDLQLSDAMHFDKTWLFCKSFGFKLEPNTEEHFSIVLFSMKTDCSIIETRLRGRDTLLAFFDDPMPYLLKSIMHHKLEIARIETVAKKAKLLCEFTPDDNFHVVFKAEDEHSYCLSDLLWSEPCYRVAWAFHVIQGCYDTDRDYDCCFEMYDGRLVSASIDYLRTRELSPPTSKNIERAIAESSQLALLSS